MLAKRQPLSKQPDQDYTSYIREVILFTDLKDDLPALSHLSEIMRHQVYKPGETILREGEAGSEMYILIRGEASVFKATAEGELYKVVILTSKQHAFFGEGGLLDNDPRSATIQADSVCECLILSRTAFNAFGESHPQWAFPVLLRIARAVMARLRKSNNDLMLLYNALVSEIRGTPR